MNSPDHTATRGIEGPRRPFLVALSLTLLVAALQWTPPMPPLQTRQAGSLVIAPREMNLLKTLRNQAVLAIKQRR